ncbi:hypothetical protein HDU93_009947 [Gonapodya sp. JEL0774]|nr:hypothetical protein HDU93_009947 [Gonapodya sp. JEL0774]
MNGYERSELWGVAPGGANGGGREEWFQQLVSRVISEPEHQETTTQSISSVNGGEPRLLLYGFVDLLNLWGTGAQAMGQALGLGDLDDRARVDFRRLAGIASMQEQIIAGTSSQVLWAEGWYFTPSDPQTAAGILVPNENPEAPADTPDEWWRTCIVRYEGNERMRSMEGKVGNTSYSRYGDTRPDPQMLSRAASLATELMEVWEVGVKSVVVLFSGSGELGTLVETALSHRARRADRFSVDETSIPVPKFVFYAPRGFMSPDLISLANLHPTMCSRATALRPPPKISPYVFDALAIDLSRRYGVVTRWCVVVNAPIVARAPGEGSWDLAVVFGTGAVTEWDRCREGVAALLENPETYSAEEAGEVGFPGGPGMSNQELPTKGASQEVEYLNDHDTPLWLARARSPTPEPEREFVTIKTRKRAPSPSKGLSFSAVAKPGAPKLASGPERQANVVGSPPAPPSTFASPVKLCLDSFACPKGLDCALRHEPEERRFFGMLKRLNAKLPGARYKAQPCRAWLEGTKCRNLDGDQPGKTAMCSWAHGSSDEDVTVEDVKGEILKFMAEEQPEEDNEDTDYKEDGVEEDEDDAEDSKDTISPDEIEIEQEEIDATVAEAVSGDAEFSVPGIITPAQVLRSGKKVWTEVRGTTLEKAEFDDEEDSDFEDADPDEEDDDEELDEVIRPPRDAFCVADTHEPQADPVNEDELRQIVKEGEIDPKFLKAARTLRGGKEIKDEDMEDVTGRIQALMN